MTLQEKYRQLKREGGALLATNFYNYETLHGVVEAARHASKPLILQLTRSSIDYLGIKQSLSMARIESSIHGIETWVHLDHGDSVDLATACVDAGFDSVMIDGSELDFEENVRMTAEVVRYAHRHGVCVEAELGFVPKLGQSDPGDRFTDPEQARDFVGRTSVDTLAVAIGTAHGFYRQAPRLDFERLNAIRNSTAIPLVLHGASGVSDHDLRLAVRFGIRKVNLATEIKNAFMSKIRKDLLDTDEIDLRKVFPPAIRVVRDLVWQKLLIVSDGVNA